MDSKPADSVFVTWAGEIVMAHLCAIWLAIMMLPFGHWLHPKIPQESQTYHNCNNIDKSFWFLPILPETPFHTLVETFV